MRKASFTLVESMIVMFLAASLILVGLRCVPHASQAQQTDQFVKKYQTINQLAIAQAIKQKSAQQIIWHANGVDYYHHHLELPKGVVSQKTTPVKVKTDGYVQPQTIRLVNQQQDEIGRIVYGLSFGDFRYEKTSR